VLLRTIYSALWGTLWTSAPTQSVCRPQRGAPQQVPTEGNRKPLAVPIRNLRALRAKNAGKRLYTKKRTNAKLLRLQTNIPRLVRHDAITFLDAILEIVLDEWLTLLAQTTLSGDIASVDPYLRYYHVLGAR
jgi:hypothetical protein